MATRLPGGAAFGWRTTDHRAEILMLRRGALLSDLSPLEAAAMVTAADLLEA